MAPSNLQHRRTHNLLLVSKLLSQRDAASPFTLVLDTLEQSARPLLAEYARRAKLGKLQVVFVSFETLQRPCNVDILIPAWSQSAQIWQKQVATHTKPQGNQRMLLLIDSLNSLCASETTNLPSLLSSFISPLTALIAVYHKDIPLPVSTTQRGSYSPPPVTLLKYLATTIFTVHSLDHVIACKAARERSVGEPTFGLEEATDGVLQGMGANAKGGIVLGMEHRRKSGRGVREWYFLPRQQLVNGPKDIATRPRESVILLEDHPSYRTTTDGTTGGAAGELEATTFQLGLTDKQRLDRDGVVLPYFDAQKGGGEGGRILYDMGVEDDFDEEEDEI